MGQATTAASGDRSHASGSSAELSSPTGPSAASDSSNRRARRKRSGAGGRRLFEFDRQLQSRFVAGADEAGRGSLAGPLVAAAVLFDYERITLADRRALAGLNDSKQRTEAQREALYPAILHAAAKVVVTARCVRGIDGRGLHVTNLAALRDCLIQVAGEGVLCLVDGFRVPEFAWPQTAVVNGDARSAAIAAASVVAKVSRDRYMRHAATVHTKWDFATNVGYSTAEHRAAIHRSGISALHRRSFQSIAYTQLALAE